MVYVKTFIKGNQTPNRRVKELLQKSSRSKIKITSGRRVKKESTKHRNHNIIFQ